MIKSAKIVKRDIILNDIPVHALLRGLRLFWKPTKKQKDEDFGTLLAGDLVESYCDIIAGQDSYPLPDHVKPSQIIKIGLYENDRTKILRHN